MKNELINKNFCRLVLSLTMAICCTLTWANTEMKWLKQGFHYEEAKENYAEAIDYYKKIINSETAQVNLIAEATYRVGICQLKQEQNEEATKTFGGLITQFGKDKAAKKAKLHLNAMKQGRKILRRLAVVTMTSAYGDLEYNAKKIEAYMQKAADKGAELVLFPELSLCGFFPETHNYAIECNSPILVRLAKKAGELNIAASVGFAEKAGDKKYVAQAFLYKGQIKSVYRKIHLHEKGFNDGERFVVVEWNGVKVGTVICNDINYPHTVREHVKRGARIILFPSVVRKPVGYVNPTIGSGSTQAIRARENGVFILIAGASGFLGDRLAIGNGMVIAPDARIVTSVVDGKKEHLLVFNIDLAETEVSKMRTYIDEDIKRLGLIEKVPAKK